MERELAPVLAARRMSRAARLVAAVALVVPASGNAQALTCDTVLQGLAHGPHGYGPRGNRCEGIYTQQVSGSTLWVASLTRSFEEYDLTSTDDLIVEWAAPDGAGVLLRAQGIKPDLYYRMDAVSPAASHAFTWPSDLLAAQRIPQGDIGVVGWTRYKLGGVDHVLLLPLSIRQHRAAAEADGYDLVLFPTEELKEVYVSLAALGADGRPTKVIQQDKPLRYGYYPAENPVHIRLRGLGDPGIYALQIGAELVAGEPAALTYWIYHAR
jgi:hypothetical protein